MMTFSTEHLRKVFAEEDKYEAFKKLIFDLNRGNEIYEYDEDGTTLVKEGTTDVKPYDKEKLPSYYSGDVQDISLEEFEELLGYKAPKAEFEFVKKNRMIVHYNTTVAQLKYARGWAGRFFARVINFVMKLLKAFGMPFRK